MSNATIRLWPELPKAAIHPNIYGHFAEHLGACTYDGIWVGKKSKIPNERGIRLDTAEAFKRLNPPVLRWPGGCFADDYHWRDGVGPQKERPTRLNIWWKQVESNEFGTDEFMRYCALAGAEPYLCVNVGSGSPQEAKEWLEYCNCALDTTLTRLRAKNGSELPYNVKYWAIGNENWGCGGRYPADAYGREYTRYAQFFRAQDPGIELVACGSDAVDNSNPLLTHWNHDFCEQMVHADLIDHLSNHRYFSRGHAIGFTDSEYRSLFGDLNAFEIEIKRADAVLAYFYPHKRVGLALDEWGLWHPEATVENGLRQESALRDAVFAGAALNLLNRYAHRVSMANIAQTFNVLQGLAYTEGPRMYLTPTYHIYDMMQGHMGAHLLTQEVDSGSYETHPIGYKNKMPVDKLSVSASIAGKTMLVTVANQTFDEDIETKIELRNVKIDSVKGTILNAPSARSVNSYDEPDLIKPEPWRVESDAANLRCVFPAHSFTAIGVTLA